MYGNKLGEVMAKGSGEVTTLPAEPHMLDVLQGFVHELRTAGLPVLVEAFLTDSGDVHLEWLIQEGGRWATAGLAVGDTQLSIADPRPFTVVPNSLLRRR